MVQEAFAEILSRFYMARLNSFYLSPEDWHEPFVLDGSEARHMLKVLRTPVGNTVRLFDGKGRSGLFTLTGATKSKAELNLESESFSQDCRNLTLAVGWNKSSRRGWLLEKAVELEVRSIIFFQAERSQGKLPSEVKDKWYDSMVSAAKQCGNVWLPSIENVAGGIGAVADLSADYDHSLVLWEDQEKDCLLDSGKYSGERSIVVVGPEGGFTGNEVSELTGTGFSPVSLGTSILRWETAALLCMSAFYLERQRNL